MKFTHSLHQSSGFVTSGEPLNEEPNTNSPYSLKIPASFNVSIEGIGLNDEDNANDPISLAKVKVERNKCILKISELELNHIKATKIINKQHDGAIAAARLDIRTLIDNHASHVAEMKVKFREKEQILLNINKYLKNEITK